MRVNSRVQQLYQYVQQDAVRDAQQAQAQGRAQHNRHAERAQQRRDRVELSPQARNMNRLRQQAERHQAARNEMLEQVRREVQQGTYQMNARRTAYGMVRENIINKIVR